MRLYNYSHPLTDWQKDELATIAGIEAEDIAVTAIPVQIEQGDPLLPQVEAMLPAEYSTDSYIVLPCRGSRRAHERTTEQTRLHQYHQIEANDKRDHRL